MAIKNLSTRAQICGRSSSCHGGHSAVEQASYIGRERIESEYDGLTYYPKYSEDLVHNEVMLPENAPEEYKNPSILWNSVEMCEKGNNAQLARTFRVQLPNEWSYDLATEVMRDYVKRNFVDKGMCVQFAIHDSENKNTGQRNLHCHMLMTFRNIDEEGKWMPKQKKVYLTDANGERIPLIDKNTGEQKVDSHNRKQWKCMAVPTNDWGNKDNVKKWRQDLADTINAVNEKIGRTENFWEYRSFQEQGLEITPQIHLGEKAAALERKGIHTTKGDINRRIIESNSVIMNLKEALDSAWEEVVKISEASVEAVKAIKNEILKMIAEVAERNHERLKLPITKTKYIRLIADRQDLQNRELVEKFVNEKGWKTFDEVSKYKTNAEKTFTEYREKRDVLADRIDYLQGLLSVYEKYQPFIKNNKERWALTGRERRQYEARHVREIGSYEVYREQLKRMIREPDKKILAKNWKAELETLTKEFNATAEPYKDSVRSLATIEVLEYNKRDLQRMLDNERNNPAKEREKSKERSV